MGRIGQLQRHDLPVDVDEPHLLVHSLRSDVLYANLEVDGPRLEAGTERTYEFERFRAKSFCFLGRGLLQDGRFTLCQPLLAGLEDDGRAAGADHEHSAPGADLNRLVV